MEEEGKGKIEETNNTTGPKAIVFIKKKKIEQQPNIASTTNQQQTNEISLVNYQETNEPSLTNRSAN
ncbi:unnamed protein product [Rotaria sp. Silwood1]|nr:unnamed protein product [Rotaria sp. Silwood1]